MNELLAKALEIVMSPLKKLAEYACDRGIDSMKKAKEQHDAEEAERVRLFVEGVNEGDADKLHRGLDGAADPDGVRPGSDAPAP